MRLLSRIISSVPFFRIAYFLTLPYYGRKNIWIVSDRPNAAGDNGEAFFRYLNTKVNNPKIKSYFVLKKNSSDFDRMSSHGKTLDINSWRYKLLFLHSEKVISSAADDFVINPFNSNKIMYLHDLCSFDFVFLQHGVTHNDLSGWLNKTNKNISLFVCSSYDEHQSILNGEYGYTKNNLLLSGMPRHDLLKSQPNKKIVIAPTWRKRLVGEYDTDKKTYYYSEDFKLSEYYKFYQALLLDDRIGSALKEADVTAEFYLHPSLYHQADDFQGAENVHIKTFPYDYKEAFEEGVLLVTDYSSVAFDFAYLKKPVIYAQFDKNDFYSSHLFARGYYSYEEDGFGPVCYDLDSTVECIISVLRSRNNAMLPEYEKRTSNFFRWFDGHNCRRVYQAIISSGGDGVDLVNIKLSARFLWRRLQNKNKPPIKMFWWRYRWPMMLNFGDEVTKYTLKSIFGLNAEYAPPDQADMVGAGSVYEIVNKRDTDKLLHIWGSGIMREDSKITAKNNESYHAIRGEITKDRLGVDEDVALGDPGILANLVFKKAKKVKYKVGVVAHYVDAELDVVKSLAQNNQILLIDPLDTPDKVARDITSCEVVFSSSLHGLIFADSFQIPNYYMPFSDKVVGGDYKFRDYYSSTNRELKPVLVDVLSEPKELERLISSYEPVPNLKKMQKDLIKAFPFPRGK